MNRLDRWMFDHLDLAWKLITFNLWAAAVIIWVWAAVLIYRLVELMR